MKDILAFGILTILVVSCTVGKQRVSFSEMNKQPSLQLKDEMIIIHTDNSRINSALLICNIEYTIYATRKVIELKGFQALKKHYKNSFELQVKGLSKKQLDKYDYFWIDPNDSKVKLEIKN